MGKPEDAASWVEAWVNSHGDRITRFAYAYTHDWNAAQDIAQETFLRLYRSRGELQGPRLSPGWLYRVSHRLCVDWYRRRRREQMLSDPQSAHTAESQ